MEGFIVLLLRLQTQRSHTQFKFENSLPVDQMTSFMSIYNLALRNMPKFGILALKSFRTGNTHQWLD